MSDVRTVFTTAEVAQMLELTPSYVLRLASRMDFLPEEFRSAENEIICLVKKLLKS